MKEFFRPSNLAPILLNVFLFITIQTTIFWFVGSNIVLDYMKRRISPIIQYLFDNQELFFENDRLLTLLKEYSDTDKVKQENDRINDENASLLLNTIFLHWLFPLLILLIIVGFVQSEFFENFSRTEWITMSLVVFAYLTELVILYFVLKQYEYKPLSTFSREVIEEVV
jgi:hypothetical protein